MTEVDLTITEAELLRYFRIAKPDSGRSDDIELVHSNPMAYLFGALGLAVGGTVLIILALAFWLDSGPNSGTYTFGALGIAFVAFGAISAWKSRECRIAFPVLEISRKGIRYLPEALDLSWSNVVAIREFETTLNGNTTNRAIAVDFKTNDRNVRTQLIPATKLSVPPHVLLEKLQSRLQVARKG